MPQWSMGWLRKSKTINRDPAPDDPPAMAPTVPEVHGWHLMIVTRTR